MVAVIVAVAFVIVGRFIGSPLPGPRLAPELILFTAAVFALLANGGAAYSEAAVGIGAQHAAPLRAPAPVQARVWTVGGTVSHIGAAVLLIGLVGLVTFVHKQTDVLLVKDLPQTVLDGQYSMTYLGQTGDFHDRPQQ